MRALGVRNVTLQCGQYVPFIALSGERTHARFKSFFGRLVCFELIR